MEFKHIESYLSKDKKICVVGLGYVGLPIALELAKMFSVIGFDINPGRVELMRKRIDPSKELNAEAFEGADIYFTANLEEIKSASFYIVAVPTPVDEHKVPDLTPLIKASETLGKVVKKGDYVVYESTVYPGCTEEDCVPVIERVSGLKSKTDFKIGYSPERINPGDKDNSLTKVVKIVSGCDEESLDLISEIYGSIITPGIFKATSIKVAEAAKVIENTQRDLNIALMNELSQIFNRMNINTFEVIEAASTKWNFINMKPGLVGGHCIGVDPYYLTYKSMELGYEPQIILSGRRINDGMSGYVAKKAVKFLLTKNKNIHDCRVLIMGATFKENVSDIRNSKVFDLYNELKEFSLAVDIVDPYADPEEVCKEYGVELKSEVGNGYDAIIIAVNHEPYLHLDEAYFTSISSPEAILMDIKNIFRQKIKHLRYWSL
jgi:UDP-N-acetyl-D-glucosamine/UDP-N-acetyl-D-galactosamine dehydrogenase